jgi:hydrogenase nickel incorporation protein HypA/HybF
LHELSVTQAILETALHHAQQAGATRVTDLNLVIGQFASIVDDSVQFYWDFIAKDTLAEGAKLHFQRIPAKLQCLDCGNTYAPGDEILTCPQCQSTQVKMTTGEEFRLESINIETAGVPASISSEK